jgi:hypothetical protein
MERRAGRWRALSTRILKYDDVLFWQFIRLWGILFPQRKGVQYAEKKPILVFTHPAREKVA